MRRDDDNVQLAIVMLIVFLAYSLLSRDREETRDRAPQLPYEDIVVGTGPVARDGMGLVAHDIFSLEDGTQISSSYETGVPFYFILGSERLIEGWNRGVRGMRVGGRRRFVVPPEMLHTQRQLDGVPPGSSLVIEVELIGVNRPEWETDPTSGCEIWDPVPSRQQSFQWSGPCVNGKASGSGVLTTFRDGKAVERYEGEMAEGRREGLGRNEKVGSPGGYRGSFRNGQAHGYGRISYSYGGYYEGEFSSGARDGTGVRVFADGRKYAGQWCNSLRHGEGVETLPGGRWRTVRYSQDKEVDLGAPRLAPSEDPMAPGGIVREFVQIIRGHRYASRLTAAAMVHLAEPRWVESEKTPMLERDGSEERGTLILEIGPWCGQGEFRVRGERGEQSLDCSGWQDIGVYPFSLPAGDYELFYTGQSCSGESFSGRRVLFSIEAEGNALVHLVLRNGFFSTEHW